MKHLHRLLQRQLKRTFGHSNDFDAPMLTFLAAVDEAYHQADQDRELLERSLELSSAELLEANRKQRRFLDELEHRVQERTEDLTRANSLLSREIIERQDAEMALREAKERAESASKAKGLFLANMSHELRTPLNGIMGMLQLVADTRLDLEQKEFIDGALTSCRRLHSLLGNVLDLSKISEGKMEIQNNEFELTRVINDVKLHFLQSAKEKNIRFAVSLGSRVPGRLLGDEIRLRQILFNLVGNAIKYTEKGSVSLTVDRLPILRDGRLRLLFTVNDTGIGIADDDLDLVFDSFSQVDSSYTRKYQGAGLGLHIVKRLVEKMGGNIALTSEPGKGSCFTISLPFGEAQSNTSDAKPEKKGTTENLTTFHILVVEDDPVGCLAIRRALEKHGFHVKHAPDGEQALHLLRNHHFDCILMDIQLPTMDGVVATRIIRSREEFKHIADTPIIALTAHAMAGDRERFLRAGMDAYVPKPFEIGVLLDVIQRTLTRNPDEECS